MIYDAHNHLQDNALAAYLPNVLPELQRIGLARAVVNGTQEADWDRVSALATEHPWILPSYGLHPWYLSARTAGWRERLTGLLETGRSAIGEIGLDRWMAGYDLQDQTEVFQWQLAMAAKYNRPASIHCLKAWGALWDILRTQPVPECGYLLHAYGGPAEMVEGFVRRGAYFSFSGYFLNAHKTAQCEVFRQIPADRLLVETDAPDMPLPPDLTRFPLPHAPGERVLNHPANLLAVYEGLAILRGWTLDALTAQVEQNFVRLFGGVGK